MICFWLPFFTFSRSCTYMYTSYDCFVNENQLKRLSDKHEDLRHRGEPSHQPMLWDFWEYFHRIIVQWHQANDIVILWAYSTFPSMTYVCWIVVHFACICKNIKNVMFSIPSQKNSHFGRFGPDRLWIKWHSEFISNCGICKIDKGNYIKYLFRKYFMS